MPSANPQESGKKCTYMDDENTKNVLKELFGYKTERGNYRFREITVVKLEWLARINGCSKDDVIESLIWFEYKNMAQAGLVPPAICLLGSLNDKRIKKFRKP